MGRDIAVFSWPGRHPVKGLSVSVRLCFEGAHGFTIVYGYHGSERLRYQRLVIAAASEVMSRVRHMLRLTLREIRELRGVSTSALATNAGVPTAVIEAIETGQRPALETPKRLARALRVSPIDLSGSA
jgi:hypothetical protein